MLEFVLSMSLFTTDKWHCRYENLHPEHHITETFVSDITYAKDLTYVSNTKIQYRYLYATASNPHKKSPVFAQFSYKSSGLAHVSGNTFYLDGHVSDIRKDFDKTQHFAANYITHLHDFLHKKIPPKEKTLTVISHTKNNMVVMHKLSGQVTTCVAQ